MRSLATPPSTEALMAAYHRTGLTALGYTFDKAMANPMFCKTITDIAIATQLTPTKHRLPAPIQQVLI